MRNTIGSWANAKDKSWFASLTRLVLYDAVYVEASYVELYEGQALHHEIERFLEESGYRLDGRFNAHLHQGEPVQADLLFRRLQTRAGAAMP